MLFLAIRSLRMSHHAGGLHTSLEIQDYLDRSKNIFGSGHHTGLLAHHSGQYILFLSNIFTF